MNMIYGTNFNHETQRYEKAPRTSGSTRTASTPAPSTPSTGGRTITPQQAASGSTGMIRPNQQLSGILQGIGVDPNRRNWNQIDANQGVTGSLNVGALNQIAARRAGAGTNTMGTSFDSTGNPILGTLGGKNIIGGQGSRVDRTAGVPQDPMSAYLQMMQGNSQEQIRRDMAKERQGQIDAIELSARQAVKSEQDAGAQDLARQRSMNLRSGLGGSDFGASNKAEIRTRTNDAVQGINAQKDMAIGGAIDRIEQLAQSRFQIEQNAMQQGFSNMMQVQQYQDAQEAQMREQTLDSLKSLGQSGMDIQTIKSRDPDLYEKLITASGMSDVEVEAVLNNAKPAPERTDYQYKVMGNKLIAYGVDPMTGQLKTMEQEVDLPDNYGISTMPDGTVLGVPDNWDGDTSKIIRVGNYAKPTAGTDPGTAPGTIQGNVDTSSLSGVAQGILRGDIDPKKITPTAYSAAMNEIYEAGFDTAFLNQDPATANLVRAATTVVRDANQAVQMLDNTKSFEKGGVIPAYTRAAKARIKGTGEYEINALIESVKSNVGIDALLNIKREGSGLGHVPQSQLETLQSLLGRLDVTRDPTLLRRDIVDIINMYEAIVSKASEPRGYQGVAGVMPQQSSAMPQGNTTRSGTPFDVQAAKSAGYTDQEIQDYINNN